MMGFGSICYRYIIIVNFSAIWEFLVIHEMPFHRLMRNAIENGFIT